jgi:hypothetical protein
VSWSPAKLASLRILGGRRGAATAGFSAAGSFAVSRRTSPRARRPAAACSILARRSSRRPYALEIVRVQRLDLRPDRGFARDGVDEPFERAGADDETGRDTEACTQQFAETRPLAADVGSVIDPDIVEPADEGTLPFFTRFHRAFS